MPTCYISRSVYFGPMLIFHFKAFIGHHESAVQLIMWPPAKRSVRKTRSTLLASQICFTSRQIKCCIFQSVVTNGFFSFKRYMAPTHLLIKYSTRHVLAHKGLHRQIHWKYFSFSEYIKWTSLIDSMPSLAFSITYWINEQWFPSQRLQYDSLNSDNPIRDFWTKLQ